MGRLKGEGKQEHGEATQEKQKSGSLHRGLGLIDRVRVRPGATIRGGLFVVSGLAARVLPAVSLASQSIGFGVALLAVGFVRRRVFGAIIPQPASGAGYRQK